MNLFEEVQNESDTAWPDDNTAPDLETLLDENGGTFKESLRAPIHRWFRFPAGFSNIFVYRMFGYFGLNSAHRVLDPFAGSATTLVCAKEMGLRSTGVEAHPLIYRIGLTKLRWDVNIKGLRQSADEVLRTIRLRLGDAYKADVSGYPVLIYKCFRPHVLRELHVVREAIREWSHDQALYGVLEVALLSTLRQVSHVGTANWQYILPSKTKATEKPVFQTYSTHLEMMLQDLTYAKNRGVESDLHLGDARNLSHLEDETVDFSFTSPPYLNNFDYADATRLELYFLGEASTWGEITQKVRNRLMTSTVTQISRRERRYNYDLLDPEMCGAVRVGLQERIARLGEERLKHGGKKNYDLVAAGYFNDMFKVLKEVYRVLKPGSHFIMILGDSAPYGVHIPTLDFLGQIAVDKAVGFRSHSIHHMRDRNTKWRNRKHDVPLMEGLLVLQK